MRFFANACLPVQTGRPDCLLEQQADKLRMTMSYMGSKVGGLGCSEAAATPPLLYIQLLVILSVTK